MSYKGIDYGLGRTNIDLETGIRFGVIPQNEVLQAWADSSEADYGLPCCPDCGNGAVLIDDENVPDLDNLPEDSDWRVMGSEFACVGCCRTYDSDEAYDDEPLGFYVDDDGYKATSDSYGDIMILKSSYFTRAQFCSPCAPGACSLMNPVDDGPKAYCFGHDWFDGGKAPYPVYLVVTGELVTE